MIVCSLVYLSGCLLSTSMTTEIASSAGMSRELQAVLSLQMLISDTCTGKQGMMAAGKLDQGTCMAEGLQMPLAPVLSVTNISNSDQFRMLLHRHACAGDRD